MFLSLRSCKTFFYINTILLSIGYIEYKASILLYYFNQYILFLGLLFIFSIRNYSLIYLVDYGASNKTPISIENNHLVVEKYPYEFHISLVITTGIETLTHIYILSFMTFYQGFSQSILFDLATFIPISFLFEIIFDFFHYSSHRLLHHPFVYRFCHKVHHRFMHPVSITTFYQDPVDLFFTNSIPTIFGFYMIPRISYIVLHWILIYKNFIEISGHCGKISYPSSCFPQCVWLPKLLGIELYTEDHDIHHSLNNCNYSKRFSLWDKLFGTYHLCEIKK